jgi:tetratricopeptide (TPR) repeat protein
VSVENNTPDTNEVSGTWRKAMNTKPTDSSTVREARRLLAKNDINAAVQRLEKFVAQYQKSDQSRYLLAQLYLSTENYSSAQRVIDGAPASLSWALLNARAQLQQGNGDMALALLQQYPEAQAREDYVDLLASAYQLQGDHRQAVQSYLTVLALNPQQARAWINMGISLEHLQQRSRAIDAYQNAIRIPDIPPALRQYAAQQLQRLQ